MTAYPAPLTPDMIYTLATLIYVTGILTGAVLTNIQNRRLDDNRPRRGDLPGAEHDRAEREDAARMGGCARLNDWLDGIKPARESVPFVHYGKD